MTKMIRAGFVAIITLVVLLSILPINKGLAADNCSGITSKTRIWWDGAELKVGQIGRLTVLKNTDLYKLDGSKESFSRTLKAGETYRIYAFKPGKLSVGGGYFVDRDTKVKYETPSKAKLAQVACKKQAIENEAKSISIGNSKSAVEQKLGAPKRVALNEYGVQWHIYHQNYDRFYMIGYVDGRVAQVYSNDTSFYVHGVTKGSTKTEVKASLGSPIKGILKGNTNYLITNSDENETFYKNNQYITVFYDLHKQGKVTSIQVVTAASEQAKPGRYGNQSSTLQQAFEIELFDLTNAARVDNGLQPLKWSETARVSSRNHSQDMAFNHFFDHINLDGDSPFDRMKAAGIEYWTAGENIAMGYQSSIFAHEALMNSLGHRKNILHKDFTMLGIGVYFQSNTQRPYYTQNFYSPF